VNNKISLISSTRGFILSITEENKFTPKELKDCPECDNTRISLDNAWNLKIMICKKVFLIGHQEIKKSTD
jgi:hypothetical protein